MILGDEILLDRLYFPVNFNTVDKNWLLLNLHFIPVHVSLQSLYTCTNVPARPDASVFS